VLLDLLKDEDWHVRWDALSSLSQTPNLPARVPQSIMPLLTQQNAELRRFVAERLATICSDETILVPALLPLLKDEDMGVRRSMVYTLARFGPKSKEVIDALCERLREQSEHPSVRSTAAYVLGNLGQAAQPAVPMLREVLEGTEGEVRIAAATALWRTTGQTTPTLPILLQALEHKDVRIREQAVQSLAVIAPPVSGVVAALVRALADPEPSVRWAACGVLERFHWGATDEVCGVIQPLARLVREEKHDATLKAAMRALGHIGPQAASAVPSLTKILIRQDPLLCMEAARALGAIGPAAKEAGPALFAAYNRGTLPFLRSAIIAALRQIDTEAAARVNLR
jgi:HEAT repeat protein